MPKPFAVAHRHTPVRTYRRSLLALSSLGAAGLLVGLLGGCSSTSGSAVASTSSSAAVTARVSPALAGNWQFTYGNAVHLSGALAVSAEAVTGVLHPSGMACTAGTAAFAVSGTVSPEGKLTLASQPSAFAGGTVSLAGTVAPDAHSLTEPTLTITGGSCAVSSTSPRSLHASAPAEVTAQEYQPITGSYSGTFTDTDGAAGHVDATLSQPTQPDSNGVYHLTGTATFANNPCLVSPVITDSTVSGNQISATYTDPDTQATITGTGTFSADASTLTIDNWVLSGSCDSDTGTGLLTRQ